MLYTIFGITLVGVIGVSILSPALPQIKIALGVSETDIGMLISAFTLPGIFFAPIMGMLADRYGRKKVLVPSLFLFAISGMLCAFADYKTMLLLRFLQGVGGSALIALSATIIGDIYEGIERARVLGYNASILAIGVASYPVIGGVLAHFNWRYPFLTFGIAIPVGIAVIFMPYPDVRTTTPLSTYLRNMRFAVSRELLFEFISGLAVFIILYGAFLVVLPLLLHNQFMADSVAIGVIIASASAFTAAISSKLAFFTEKFGSVGTIRLGFVFYTLSMLVMPFIPSLPLFFIATFLFGLGHGTVLPSLQNLIISTAKDENRAAVMTVYGSIVRMGQTIGPIVFAPLSANLVFIMAAILALFFSASYTLMYQKSFNPAPPSNLQ